MGWRQFVMDLETLEPQRVEEIFTRHGALAVTLSNAGDDPILEPAPGETPLWADSRITGLFDEQHDLGPLRAEMMQTFELHTLPRSRVEVLVDRAWEREWLKDFGPMQFGRRLWVSPHRCDVPDDNAVVIRLDPGMAFGTGTHPTTALCLEWLDTLDLDAKRVLDFGCGSGILAIGALLCGARAATALDIDRQAITACCENAAANGVAERLRTTMTSDDLKGTYDVVIANILAQPLIDLAPLLLQQTAAGSRIALSGILSEQIGPVQEAYARHIDFETPGYRDDWARLNGVRR